MRLHHGLLLRLHSHALWIHYTIAAHIWRVWRGNGGHELVSKIKRAVNWVHAAFSAGSGQWIGTRAQYLCAFSAEIASKPAWIMRQLIQASAQRACLQI
jgi:hypothetical protein